MKLSNMENPNRDALVLVTGGTGFVGIHCVLTLLNAGYSVRTTLRKLNRQDEVVDALRQNNADGIDNLSFVEADLASDSNWNQAVKDCKYLLHVASPIGIEKPQDESYFIGPAVEGTLRVLRAARDAGVKRVVLLLRF